MQATNCTLWYASIALADPHPVMVSESVEGLVKVGGPIEATNMMRGSFRRVVQRASTPRIRFHDLRHTAASLLLGARVNPKVMSEMLGHSTVSITLDIYAHVLPDMQQDAATTIQRLLFLPE